MLRQVSSSMKNDNIIEDNIIYFSICMNYYGIFIYVACPLFFKIKSNKGVNSLVYKILRVSAGSALKRFRATINYF